jgi:hypothetical protein
MGRLKLSEEDRRIREEEKLKRQLKSRIFKDINVFLYDN